MRLPIPVLPPALRRAGMYLAVGISTFFIDFLILYTMTTWGEVHYPIAAGVGFLIGISLNYILSQRYVFRYSARKFPQGYAYMVLAAAVGMLATTGLTVLLVEMAGIYYLTARVMVAGLVGIGNYLFNLYLNFKVAGKHDKISP